MWQDKDGWPMLSWYDYVSIWFRDSLVTLGWRISNVGHWLVRKAHRGGQGKTAGSCFECDTPLIGPLCPACNPMEVDIPFRFVFVMMVASFVAGGCFGMLGTGAYFLISVLNQQ